ncbi:hypothetical protein [Streptomyces solicathayae]|uniref:Uncharacterized protein n=1 Tax=Streptomyces solicathayae TaxID=3081768 RepID=A0ABZ0M0A2_9ACTN|nr:hypothetical protein [Streptomyces sp. HUAS YS2]WOX25111.1 hypothetical protein R2D22_28480 [Streptomyces sp. HUAS YS2]
MSDPRPSDDLAATFARMGGPDEEKIWSALFDDICHQGSVYDDSFLALPFLAAIAKGDAPGDVHQAVSMAGLIVSAADEGHTERYADEIAALRPVGRRLLTTATGHYDFVDMFQCVLAFEGERLWSQSRLEGLVECEYEVECPSCWSELLLSFDDDGDADYAEAGRNRTPLRPADPRNLGPIPARLRLAAAEARLTNVARGVTFLFGTADCPDCEAAFAVSEQVAARPY